MVIKELIVLNKKLKELLKQGRHLPNALTCEAVQQILKTEKEAVLVTAKSKHTDARFIHKSDY